MEIKLADVTNENIILFLTTRPANQTKITITDNFCFTTQKYTEKLAQGLNLLPNQIKKVSFSGCYYAAEDNDQLIIDVGSALSTYCDSLPDTVNSLSLDLNGNYEHAKIMHKDNQLSSLIQNLKKNITELDLSGIRVTPGDGVTVTANMYTLYEKIPLTVKSLKITHNLGKIPATIEHLYFDDFNWSLLSLDDINAYFDSLPKDLKSLNFANCSFDTLVKFDRIINKLPKKLVRLGLSNNLLNLFTDADFTAFNRAIEKIHSSVEEVHFSEKSSLDYNAPKLAKILNSLPKTVTRLQLNPMIINENVNTVHDIMKQHLGVIPEHIHTLITQGIKINSENAAIEVADTLKGIPNTVNTIVFKELFSQETDPKEIDLLCTIFTDLPKSVTHIKLPGNNLSNMPPETFTKILSSFSTHIKSIDISDNGFTDLSPARLQSFTAYCPQNATNILLDKKKFVRKLNGMLDRNPAPSVYMDFPNPVMIPKEFAQQILIFSQVVTVLNKKLPLELCLIILSLAFPGMGTDYKRKVQFENKIARKFFSSHLLADNQKTDEIMDNAKQRLLNQTTVADLSHCGLHLLKQSELTELMKTIIPPCEIINLRGNGFGNTPEARVKLRTLLNAIPPHIRYIDLGANHLERANPKELDALIPKQATYSFSLNDETPLSRKEHLIMRKKYSANHQITGSESELIKHVQKILKGYTSSVKRIFFLPQYSADEISSIDKIKRLEQQIQYNQITRLDDLFYQLDMINKDAPTSSLAQLTYKLRNTLVLIPEQGQQFPAITNAPNSDNPEP